MSLHKHGDSWCLCGLGGTKPSDKEHRMMDGYIIGVQPPINLHYHNGMLCTDRLCRKRGTPKVKWQTAFWVLSQGQRGMSHLRRCPRCKTHLKRGERADLHYVSLCKVPDPPHPNYVTHHWCCPPKADADGNLWARCEWIYAASAKELRDDAVIESIATTQPAGRWTDAFEAYALHNPFRHVPLKVFYAKIKRLERAGRIHGCLHSSASTACLGDLHLPGECQGC